MAATRFMRKGITKFYFVTTVSSASAPTAAELNAGTNITPQIAAVNGFSWTNEPIDVPDMNSTFVQKIGGQDTTEDTNFELYQLRGGTDTVYSALVKGTVGYVAIAVLGLAGATWAVADKVDLWSCTVTSKSKVYTADNEAAKYRVAFSLNAVPLEDYSIAS